MKNLNHIFTVLPKSDIYVTAVGKRIIKENNYQFLNLNKDLSILRFSENPINGLLNIPLRLKDETILTRIGNPSISYFYKDDKLGKWYCESLKYFKDYFKDKCKRNYKITGKVDEYGNLNRTDNKNIIELDKAKSLLYDFISEFDIYGFKPNLINSKEILKVVSSNDSNYHAAEIVILLNTDGYVEEIDYYEDSNKKESKSFKGLERIKELFKGININKKYK